MIRHKRSVRGKNKKSFREKQVGQYCESIASGEQAIPMKIPLEVCNMVRDL